MEHAITAGALTCGSKGHDEKQDGEKMCSRWLVERALPKLTKLLLLAELQHMHFSQLKQAEAVQEMAIVLAVAACPESHLQNTAFGKLCSERGWQRCG